MKVKDLISGLEYLNLPTKIGIILVGLFIVMQVIGEITEFTGKTVPEILKIRKIFTRKRKEKEEEQQTLKDVQKLLSDVYEHYSTDNIKLRDDWIKHINDKETVYDASVKELTALKERLELNNELTLDMYIDFNRNRILDFASKVANENLIISKEEFNRIYKVYDAYEEILRKNTRTNGEVDIAYKVIQEAYQERLKHHTFLEDVRGYK